MAPLPKRSDPHLRLEALERWSGRATLLILVGILVEVWQVIYFPHEFIERITSLAANALIGIGLIIEYIVIVRAVIAGRESQALSDQKVSEANDAAARALERASLLEKEAAEARERAAQIELLTMPRRISLEQRNKIADAVRGKTPNSILIRYSMFDHEAAVFALELNDVFLEANTVPPDWQGKSDLSDNNLTFGLFIESQPDLYATVVIQAFREAGILVTRGVPRDDLFPNSTGTGTRLFVYVGHKPLPKAQYGFLASRE